MAVHDVRAWDTPRGCIYLRRVDGRFASEPVAIHG
jgi:hypothetical protein